MNRERQGKNKLKESKLKIDLDYPAIAPPPPDDKWSTSYIQSKRLFIEYGLHNNIPQQAGT